MMNRARQTGMTCALGALLALAGAAQAGVIYHEGVSGDLFGSLLGSQNLGTLAAGANMVIGSLDGGTTTGKDGPDAQDSFSFTSATDWSLHVDALLDGADGTGLVLALFGSNLDLLANDLITAAPSGSLGNWGPGTYYVGLLPNVDKGQVSYTINLRMSVPEPGTFALLGFGLAGLAAARRRKE